MNIHDFTQMKIENRKISMVTAYDFFTAQSVEESNIDCILVGDSVAMVVHGFESTIHATPEIMKLHTAAVRRGAKKKFIIADMPFLSFRMGIEFATQVSGDLLKAGANAVKIENLKGHEQLIEHLVNSGVPVMGHLGLTPQFIHQIGGYKVQGRSEEAKVTLLKQAQELQNLGCFALVLECVPALLAESISKTLSIPVIGIGAGAQVDGQVLVYHDLLGINSGFKPKFVRTFSDVQKKSIEALNQFHKSVLDLTFPSEMETYHL